jgi:monoamine oxidase
MSRSSLFGFLRAMRIAHYCEKNKISTSQGLEQIAALEARVARSRLMRREFLMLSGVSAFAAVSGKLGRTYAQGQNRRVQREKVGSARVA